MRAIVKVSLSILSASLLMTGVALAQNLAEPQITEIMKVANEGEISAAKLAKQRAQNDQVKAFANKMIDEHRKNEKDVKKVSSKKDIGMDNSEAAKALKKQAKETVKNLKDKKDAEFDKAYMASQVDMHQSLLDQIEDKFMPAVQTPELKDYLAKTRDHVKVHLEEAKAIQRSIQ